ncbi:MAG: hypothetical protein KDD63_18685, partial [Bacteroidetes bacterium]|nr:hypothetical protein [Bacteroidota bacterium]
MKKAFRKAFWNAEESCLYDFIDRDYKDPSVRPNQLFAISLPFSLLTIKQSAQLLEKVESTLFTPRGLRSLSPEDKEYQGVYFGDRLTRDNAYHKGTVWAWLIGPFIDALIKVKGIEGRLEARMIVENFLPHFSE